LNPPNTESSPSTAVSVTFVSGGSDRAGRRRAAEQRRGVALAGHEHLTARRLVVDRDERLLALLDRVRLLEGRAVGCGDRDRQLGIAIRELEHLRDVAEVLAARDTDRDLEPGRSARDDLQGRLAVALVREDRRIPARRRIVQPDRQEWFRRRARVLDRDESCALRQRRDRDRGDPQPGAAICARTGHGESV